MNKKKSILKISFIVFACGLTVFFSAYIYLYANLKQKEQTAQAKKQDVPYSAEEPKNSGLLINFPDNSRLLVYLDFASQMIFTSIIEDNSVPQKQYYGYTVNYNVNADYNLISAIIDRIGGIELNLDGKELRYTGVQITDIISSKTDISSLKRDIICAVFKKISKNGFSKDDFVYIIENSETDLTVPDCYYWQDYIGEMSSRFVLTN